MLKSHKVLLQKIIPGIFLLAAITLQAQEHSFIGMSKDETEQRIKKEYSEYSQDNSIIKKQFNYLKYVNMSQTITWILYFSADDYCTGTKKVCDYIEYDVVIARLNKNCDAAGNNKWEYSDSDQEYMLLLEEEDWYFTVRERLKE